MAGKGTVQAGKDFLIYYNTATAESPNWALIGGQKSGGISIKADDIDATHKTSGGWKTSIPGLKEWSTSLDGVYLASDDSVKFLHETAVAKELKTPEFAFVFPDKKYVTGLGSITSFDIEGADDGTVTYKGEIKGVGPLSEIKEEFTTSKP